MCVCGGGGGGDKLHDYDSRPKSVCLCKRRTFRSYTKKKKKKKMFKKRRTEESHNELYQIPLASTATTFD